MKKVSLLLILVLSALSLSAQDSGKSEQAGRKATFTRNHFFDNWFVGAGAGANMYFGKQDNKAGFFKRPTVMGTGQIGKWFNPYLGARLRGSLGKVHTFTHDANVMNRQIALTGEVDFMFDAINYFGRYDENRLYSIIPYVGVGGAYGRGYSINTGRHHEKTLTFNAGLINDFRITDKLSAQVELSAMLLKDDFDRRVGGNRAYDLLGQASVGIVYKIGKNTTNFSEAHLMDQSRLDALNDEINKLKQENNELSRRPKNCPDCPEVESKVVEVETKGISGNAVFFKIGSATIDKNQEGNIYTVGKYLQDNPSEKVTIVGYADKQTGSTAINQRLSERRAKKVADALVSQYNIDRSRLDIDWKGDTVQPYSKNAWNRVVIFISE